MKNLNEYTILCTEEQAMKAIELGASINNAVGMTDIVKEKYFADGKGNFIILPTAEQMIGWLMEQGAYIIVPIPLIKDFNKKDFSKADEFEYRVVIDGSEVYCGAYLSRKEATLSAIDDALGYLEKMRQSKNDL